MGGFGLLVEHPGIVFPTFFVCSFCFYPTLIFRPFLGYSLTQVIQGQASIWHGHDLLDPILEAGDSYSHSAFLGEDRKVTHFNWFALPVGLRYDSL